MGSFLDTPATNKTTHRESSDDLRAGVSSMQGWRVSMEDAHQLVLKVDGHPTIAFAAVFDGHGGSLVSEHSAAHVVRHVTDTEAWKSGPTVDTMQEALRHGFLSLDRELKELPEVRRGDDHSGSTAIATFITPTHIICGNAGDSRSVLVRESTVTPMSFDHKPFNEGEQKRIEEAGGMVSMRRVNGDLAVSRALGDFVYKRTTRLPPERQQVTALPDTIVEERKPGDQYLVLACDGIWDVMSNDDVGEFLRNLVGTGCDEPGDMCEELLDHCLQKGSRDNMSVVIIAFPGAPKASPDTADAYRKKRDAKAADGADSGPATGAAPSGPSAGAGGAAGAADRAPPV